MLAEGFAGAELDVGAIRSRDGRIGHRRGRARHPEPVGERLGVVGQKVDPLRSLIEDQIHPEGVRRPGAGNRRCPERGRGQGMRLLREPRFRHRRASRVVELPVRARATACRRATGPRASGGTASAGLPAGGGCRAPAGHATRARLAAGGAANCPTESTRTGAAVVSTGGVWRPSARRHGPACAGGRAVRTASALGGRAPKRQRKRNREQGVSQGKEPHSFPTALIVRRLLLRNFDGS